MMNRSTRGGGVAVLSRKKFEIIATASKALPMKYEIVGVLLKISSVLTLWCWSLYLSPCQQRRSKLEIIKEVMIFIDDRKSDNESIIYMGDFNIPFIKWNNRQEEEDDLSMEITANELTIEIIGEFTGRNLIQLIISQIPEDRYSIWS